MRLIGASIMTAMGALAFGPANAQVDPLAPLPLGQSIQARPAVIQPAQTFVSRPVYAAPTGFAGYKLRLAALARSQGVRESTIQAHVPALNLNSRAIQLDQSQPGGPPNSNYIPPFSPYQRRHVTSDLIRRGQARYSSLYGNLSRIQSRYGVDPGVLMAIYGHETSYGAVTGGFDLLDVLGSLAYEGRRRQLRL